MRIIPLSEGSFSVDKSKRFEPFDKSSDNLQQRSTGSLLVEIQPFVVITSEDVIILDAGLGFETNGMLQLHHNLMNAGIQPGEVTKVLLSHLHKDHTGGLSDKVITGNNSLSFPNATYYVQEKELAYAFDPANAASYKTEELECLKTNVQQVQLLNGDGILDGYIKYQVSGAHCPYHQVFWIVDGGQTVFFGGDVAPQLQQMKSRFMAKYDYDGKLCMELRQQWWQQGEETGWTFLFYHDIKMPVYNF